jgi:hypothetical protein
MSRGMCLWRLTFELSRTQRWDARPGLAKMYTVPPARAWWPAVGARLERGVRPHLAGGASGAKSSAPLCALIYDTRATCLLGRLVPKAVLGDGGPEQLVKRLAFDGSLGVRRDLQPNNLFKNSFDL